MQQIENKKKSIFFRFLFKSTFPVISVCINGIPFFALWLSNIEIFSYILNANIYFVKNSQFSQNYVFFFVKYANQMIEIFIKTAFPKKYLTNWEFQNMDHKRCEIFHNIRKSWYFWKSVQNFYKNMFLFEKKKYFFFKWSKFSEV